jgi:voltage-gated potassium channel
VTLTTVGYGDIVPKTSAGRWAGVAVMITGISVLGLLAGSLASFFRLDDQPKGESGGGEVPDIPSSASAGEADLIGEIALLRVQVARLAERLDRTET